MTEHAYELSGLCVGAVCALVVGVVMAATIWCLWRQHTEEMTERQAEQAEAVRQRCSSVWTDDVLRTHRVAFDGLVIDKLLGTGQSTTDVFLATFGEQLVACRQLKRVYRTDHASLVRFMEQIRIMATFSHPNVVEFYGVAWDNSTDLSQLTEYMENTDVRTFLDLHDSTTIGWDGLKLDIAIDVVRALEYMHTCTPKLIHGDVKSRAVLLNAAFTAKLSDFGGLEPHRRVMPSSTRSSVLVDPAALYWTAPEVLAGNQYDEMIDIYAVGIMLSELDTHTKPFHEASDELSSMSSLSSQRMMSQAEMATFIVNRSLSLSFSQSCPSEIMIIATRCFSNDPTKRPTASELVERLTLMRSHLVQDKTMSGRSGNVVVYIDSQRSDTGSRSGDTNANAA